MRTENVKIEAAATGAEVIPTVTAKRPARVAQTGSDPGSKEERNAAEISRLAAWVIGEGGEPVLAD